MHVRRICLRGFMGHESYDLELPDKGIVLVTGPNGVGKSSFIEAPPVCLWGKTLRGTYPWHDRGSVEIELNPKQVVKRTRRGTRSTLEIDGVQVFDTVTKSQEWVLSKYGTFDVWRRTHVLSSADASHFSMASDAERKRLLEHLLDLAPFDMGSKACREDLRQAREEAASQEARNSVLSERLERLSAERQRVLKRIKEAGRPEDTGRLHAEIAQSQERLASFSKQISVLVKERNRIRDRGIGGQHRVNELERRVQTLSEEACPTCEQPIPEVLRSSLADQLTTLRRGEEQVHKEAVERLASIEADWDALKQEARTEEVKRQRLESRLIHAKQLAKLAHSINEEHSGIQQQTRQAFEELEDAEDRLLAAREELGILNACDKVLGLKGVRAALVSRTLTGIEQVTNSWLARVAGPGLAVALKPYREKRSGGVTDAINLDVAGAGGGYGYKASSGGERRRIDIAILLALADVACAAYGRPRGTLFFDEVFDSLDPIGSARAADVLAELSQERAVVIISHSEPLAEILRVTKHVRL